MSADAPSPHDTAETGAAGRRTAAGGAAAIAGQALRFGATLAAQVALARLLLPEEYGITAMAFTVTGLLAVVNESGFSLATLQKAELSRAESNAAFWLQLLVSAGVAALAIAVAPAAAAWFDEPLAGWIIVALAPSFLLNGAYAQHQALVRRHLRFRTATMLEVGASILGLGVAIAAAALGAGVWALVAQQLTTPIVLLPGFWLASGWRPGRPSLSAARSHFDFGKHFTGYKLVEYASKYAADRILLGAMYGARDLGLYTRASSFLTAPLAQVSLPLSMVMLPALSRVQGDPEPFRALFLGATRALGWLTLPAAAFLAVAAPEVVLVLLGERWAETIGIFRWASPGALAVPLTVVVNWLFLTRGRTDRMLRWGIGSALVTLLASAVGVAGGPEGLALARSLAAITCLVGGIVYGVRETPVRVRDFAPALGPPLVGAIATGLAVGAVRLVASGGPLGVLAVEGLVAGATVGAGLAITGDHRRLLALFRPARSPAPAG